MSVEIKKKKKKKLKKKKKTTSLGRVILSHDQRQIGRTSPRQGESINDK